jgi:cell division protein FtsB
MGIHGFTKVFPPKKEIKYTELKNKNIIIDARTEIYRAALGMKVSDSLTDSSGRPTTHINAILLGVILKLKAHGANQYWVFDYNQKRKSGEDFHIQLKELELLKRNERKQKSREKLKDLKKQKQALEELAKSAECKRSDSELFSSSDEDTQKDLACCITEIDKHEKKAFNLEKFYTDDTIFMLNMLDIPWLMCPSGFEAEQICAMATRNSNIVGIKMDYVLTPDADAIPFGAARVIKRDIRKKKLFEYDTQELLDEHKLSQDDIIKISLILGCDYAKKTPRIGEKTVLKKYKDVVLTDEQKIAFDAFKRELTKCELDEIELHNADVEAFTDFTKYTEMLDWLQLKKCFNRGRINTQFKKNGLFTREESD